MGKRAPVYKVKRLQVGSYGKTETVKVPSRSSILNTQPEIQVPSSLESMQSGGPDVVMDQSGTQGAEPDKLNSKYYSAKKKVVEQWTSMRDRLADSRIEGHSPLSFDCSMCHVRAVNDIVHCDDCGPITYLCPACADNVHSVHPLHSPMQWKGMTYVAFKPSRRQLDFLHDQDCGLRRYTRPLQVFDARGKPHTLSVEFCLCDDEATSLVRRNLWPSKPKNPQVAYHLGFLKLAKMILLECQVSLKSFCAAICAQFQMLDWQTNNLYRVLILECFEEFRHSEFWMQRKVAVANYSCPACPKEGAIVSMDANFGLVRKKSAGIDVEGSKREGTMFLNQHVVDQFVEDHGSGESTTSPDCSNFQAGNSIRGKGKTGLYDIKGVFGAVCRHELPLKFMDLKHGERLAYPILLLNKLKGGREKMLVTYDIACILQKHLKKSSTFRELLVGLKFAVPVFHVYGHKTLCQVQFNPRRLEGFGLTDGEGIERLWSFLRNFSKITKEMTPSHRTDLLTDALMHYSERKLAGLGVSLKERLRTAEQTTVTCATDMQAVAEEYNMTLTSADFEMLLREENCQLEAASGTQKLNWEEQYAKLVSELHVLRTYLHAPRDTPETVVETRLKIEELDSKLSKIEKRHKLQSRWTVTSSEYLAAQLSTDGKAQINLLQKMLSDAIDWKWTIGLKKRYAVGQDVGLTICSRLSKIAEKINRHVKTYNKADFRTPGLPVNVSFADVSDPMHGMYFILGREISTCQIPVESRRRLLDLHFKKLRAEEEKGLCKADVTRLTDAIKEQRSGLVDKFKDVTSTQNSRLRLGLLHCIHSKCVDLEVQYEEIRRMFPEFNIPDIDISFSLLEDYFHGDCSLGMEVDADIVRALSLVRYEDEISDVSDLENEDDKMVLLE